MGGDTELTDKETIRHLEERVKSLHASLYSERQKERRRFAMAAMQGILSGRNTDYEYKAETLAKEAVQYADELLKALEP